MEVAQVGGAARHGSAYTRPYAIPQTDGIDNEDRVEKGAQLLHHMAEGNL